jgi:hypothetical protein
VECGQWVDGMASASLQAVARVVELTVMLRRRRLFGTISSSLDLVPQPDRLRGEDITVSVLAARCLRLRLRLRGLQHCRPYITSITP